MNKDIKKEVDEIMKKEGNLKGSAFLSVFYFIRQKEGEEGLKKVEEKFVEIGYPFKEKDISVYKYYLNGYLTTLFIIGMELFNWNNDDIYEIGSRAPRLSFINKMLVSHFSSIEVLSQRGSEHWNKYSDVGKLSVPKFSAKERFMVVRIEDFEFHPLLCFFVKGYIKGLVDFTAKGVEVSEQKCIYRGDKFHEYLVRWD